MNTRPNITLISTSVPLLRAEVEATCFYWRHIRQGRGFPDGLVIPDMASHVPHIRCFKCTHTIPTFKLSNTVLMLAKNAAREQKLGLAAGGCRRATVQVKTRI